MNKQEIFDKVSLHLLAQGVASYGSSGCRYRGPNGTSCAVGCLIPDSMYDPDMEDGVVKLAKSRHFSFATERVNEVITKLGLAEHWKLLRHLQKLHDTYMPRAESMYKDRDMESVKYGLLWIAKEHDLKCELQAKPVNPGGVEFTLENSL